MKTNRGYLGKCIALQMVLLPVVLTLASFFYPGVENLISEALTSAGFGNDVMKLARSAIIVIGTFLICGLIGFLVSRYDKNKPAASGDRYTGLLIPLIYAIIFAVSAVILSKGNYNSPWWGVYLFKNPVFFLIDVALAFTGMNELIAATELAAYSSFGLGYFVEEMVSGTVAKDKSSRKMKISFAALCIAVMAFIGYSNYDTINNGFVALMYGESTVGKELTEYDLLNIAPFRDDNGLARLDGEASLQFTELEQMPRLDGATAAYPVYAAFTEAVYKGLADYYYANRNNNDKDIDLAFVESDKFPTNIVKCSKTGGAYERLINGDTDIIFVAEPSKEHNELIKSKGDEFVLTPIAYEAFVFFTNTRNPVENLTIEQIQDIYSGRITNWKAVGGPGRSILAYQRPKNSGSQTIMENKVMKGKEMMEPTKESLAEGMGGIIKQVASYKNAKNSIGYSFLYYSSAMIRNNQIKYIAVNGIKPSTETVRSRQYPFTVPVYAVTLKSNEKDNVRRLIDWILSAEGQSLIEKTGYIPAK